METHYCIICMGSNQHSKTHLENARKKLNAIFPDIRYSRLMTTEAIGETFQSPFLNQLASFSASLPLPQLQALLKAIEKEEGRKPEDKQAGIVILDLDVLIDDNNPIKPDDLKRDYVKEGLTDLQENGFI